MLVKQNMKKPTLSEMNIRLLGRQYKLMNIDFHFVSSGLKRKNNINQIEGVSLFTKQKFATQIICSNRGLHE